MDAQNTRSVKRVKTSNLKPNMIVANNVVNDAGLLLVAKNTLLTRGNFNKLVENNVLYVYIIQSSINDSEQSFLGDSDTSPPLAYASVKDTPQFRKFEQTIEESTEEVKATLLSVRDGSGVNIKHVSEITEDVMKTVKYKNDVFSYLNHLRDRDEYTYGHCANVSLLSNLFGKWLGFPEEKLMNLTAAASLHDLGKTQIPDNILNKKGKLTDLEMEIMRSHSRLGYNIMQRLDIPNEVKYVALYHHERIDGSGYPKGLKHDEIPEFAKIVSICDIYDAMTSKRVYRDKLCPFDVIKKFEHSSFGELDPVYLQVFLQNIAYTYVGNPVKLTDDRVAKVAFINPNYLSAPIVDIDGELVDLSTNRKLHIAEVL